MSKYSGLFLSLLLVMICLWINICRYPSVWIMLNGSSSSNVSENISNDSRNATKSSKSLDVESENVIAVGYQTENNNSHVIDFDKDNLLNITENASEKENSVPISAVTNLQSVDKQTEQKNPYRNASLSYPVSEKEEAHKNRSNSSNAPQINQSTVPSSSQKSENVYSGINAASFSQNLDNNDKNQIGTLREETIIPCYTPYKAVGSAETKPMVFETPNYLNENMSQNFSYIGS